MKTPFTLTALMLVLLTAALPARAENVGSFEDHSDVGEPANAGTAKYEAAALAYTVTGGGANMWQAKDSFHFVWKKVSGDLVLTADVALEGKGTEPHRKACLLVRQSLDADSVYADAALHGDGTAALQHRDAKGALTSEVKANILNAPRRLRLEKVGRTITLLVPGAGGEFVPAGKIELELTGPFYVGLGVCAHNDAQLETAVFSNVELQLTAAPAKKPATELPESKDLPEARASQDFSAPRSARAQAAAKAGSFTALSSSTSLTLGFKFARMASKSALSAAGSWNGWSSALMMLMARNGSSTVTGAVQALAFSAMTFPSAAHSSALVRMSVTCGL